MKKKLDVTTDPKKEFQKLVRSFSSGGHQTWRVFSDFCEMAALSLANVVEKKPEREERYMKLVNAYSKEEQAIFPQLLGCVTMGLEDLDCDFLGECFQELELANHWQGQFFTPMSVCTAVATMTLGDAKILVDEKGFISVNEPACGAGAMLIAVVDVLRKQKLNPQQCLHVTAQDKDPTAAHMCFVQLALLGIPAHVVIGDTLRVECREVFTTMFHHAGMWDQKLRRGYALGTPADPDTNPPSITPELADHLAELAAVLPGEVVLVPFARDGLVAQAVMHAQPEAHVMCLEDLTPGQAALERAGFMLVGADLSVDPEALPPVDKVVMHVPFALRADPVHVLRAYEFLRDGDFACPSRIVATMDSSVMTSDAPASQDFRGFLHAGSDSIVPLPDDPHTCVVVIIKG